jgi:hypothetical protein
MATRKTVNFRFVITSNRFMEDGDLTGCPVAVESLCVDELIPFQSILMPSTIADGSNLNEASETSDLEDDWEKVDEEELLRLGLPVVNGVLQHRPLSRSPVHFITTSTFECCTDEDSLEEPLAQPFTAKDRKCLRELGCTFSDAQQLTGISSFETST